jgi:hypothetical protein
MSRGVLSRLRRPSLVLAVALVSIFSISSSSAGEWVYFKNGHKILADAVREEGDLIFLRIGAGNEIGYPKQLIERAKASAESRVSNEAKAHPTGGRGRSFDQLQGYERAARELGRSRASALISSHAMKSGQRYSYGFSFQDSTDLARMQTAKPNRSLWDARAALGQSAAAAIKANQQNSLLGTGDGPPHAGAVGSSLRVVNKDIDQRRGNTD